MSDNPFALSNIQTANDQPQRDENPFSLSSIARDQGQDLRTELQRAVRTNPDQAAEVDRLAKQYPAPKDVLLRNLQDVQLQAAVDAADEKLRTSPKLADYMRTSPWVAKQSHDDVDALTQIAQFFSDTGGSVKAGVFNASKGAAGVFRAGAELIAPPLDVLENVTAIGGNPLRRLAEGFAMLAEQNAASAKAVTPKTTGVLDSGFQSGVQSLTQNLLTLPLAFAPGGQAAALGGMVSFTGGQSYQDAREKGLPMSQALPFAASQAAIEYATEKLPLGALIKDVKAGTPFFETLAKQIAMEVPGEQLATLMQDLNEWAVLNPDKPFTSYIDERPSAAAQTLVATIVGAGGNVAVMKGIEKALTIGTDNAAKIADAERVNAGLQDAMKAAAASKLRERNPETFKQLVQHLAEENDGQAPTSVFIDAALLQGVNVAEVLPSAAERMADALATNGSVEVSISDVLTAVPGTPLEQVFLQNARATPDGISMAEAEQAFKQADQWKAEADRVMAEAQDQAAWQASADNVKANLLGQLNTAGRFTPEVNEAYATLVRDFYATMAGRQGITPEEMFAKYPLRIAAQGVGGQQLDQVPAPEGALTGVDGKPLRLFHGTNAVVTKFDPAMADSATGESEGATWFSSAPEVTERFGGVTMPAYVTPGNALEITPQNIGDFLPAFGGGMVVEVDGRAVTADINREAVIDGQTVNVLDALASGRAKPVMQATVRKRAIAAAKKSGVDVVVFRGFYDASDVPSDIVAVLDPSKIVSSLTGETLAQSAPFNGTEQATTPIGDATEVEVDGKMRPALNSNGQPIHWSVEGVRNFWRWFGDSKVVDKTGRPVPVFHGSTADIEAFDPAQANDRMYSGGTENTVFFTDNADVAASYAGRRTSMTGLDATFRDGGNVTPVYLKISKPLKANAKGENWRDVPYKGEFYSTAELTEVAKSEKKDGMVVSKVIDHRDSGITGDKTKKPSTTYAVFNPTQIKSATGNSGAFSGQDANILRQSGLQDGTVALRALADEGNNQAILFQALVDGLGMDTQQLADVFESVASLSESDSFSSVPALQPVLTQMRSAILDDPKVLDAIVGAIPVDVVNNLAGSEAAAKVLLNDQAMLQDSPAFNAELPVAEGVDAANTVGLLVRQAAIETAKVAAVPLRTGLEAQKNATAMGARQGNGLGQAESFQQKARATYSPDQILITLNENADLSSFLHESGHFFLEVMADLASQPNAPADIQDDMNRLLEWFGVADVATWQAMTLDQKRPHHERFAESFEQYLLEGKAPSQELQPLFRKFRAWLVNVYKSLTQFMRGRDLKLSDEVRRVFDRMLAAEDAIKAQEEASGLLPDFDATNEAIEKLQARSLRDLKWTVNARNRALKALQKEAAYLRKAVEDEVRAEVEARPEVRAKRALSKLKKPSDLEIAAVADATGFESTEAMLKAIDDFGDIKAAIEGMTDQRMLENFGELATPEAIEEAANDAVHNEARAKSLATELKAQADMLNTREQTGTASNGRAVTVNALTRAAKEFGANLAARRKISDLKRAAQQHRAAEAKAGRAWQEATAKGQTQEAVAAKRDQVLNNAAVKALNEAQAEAKKIVEFFRKVTKDNNEKLVDKGRDPDVVNAMRAILAAYDVAPRLEKSATEYMELVARNDPGMYGALKPAVDAAMANAKPLSEMTMEELRGLNDELRSMWHLAKRSRQMEIDGNLLDRQELEAQLTARMGEIGIPDTIPGERGSITAMEEAGIKLQFAKAILSRVEQWAERLDGQYGGPFLRYIFQPVKAAADRYRAARTEYRKKFTALVDNIAPLMPPGAIAAPELGYTFGNAKDSGMAELLHAILHTGNDSNKRKLLLGRQWATENPDGTMDTSRWDAFITRMINEGKLTKAHYDFAQGVWDLLEEAKPLAQKAHREVFGRYFAEVTANALDTPFGSYRGGYVPAQTDSRIVTEAKLRELAEAENESMAYAFPAAPNGFTKARVEYNKPLLLDLRTLPQHLDKVLLFSHMQPTINDVRRLLTAKSVSYGLDRLDPGAYEGMLTPWLKRSAQQVVETPVVGDRKLSRFLAAARSRAGMALMFANLSNTVQQITGFSLAAVKVKPSLMMSALGRFVASPKQTREAVATASIFMRDRMENEVAALNNVVEEILVNPSLYERSQAWTQRHAYFLQSAVDNTMAPIIWTAAYNQAIEQKMDHGEAVKYADGVIRQTQGSTLPEDVSRFETGPAMVRVFTQFVGYFNMMANTNATAVSQIVNNMGLRKGAGKLLYVALAGLFVPIWVAEAIAVAFKGGPDDEDRDGYLDDWLAAVFGIGTFKGLVAQVPIVGQAAQMVVNQFNTNPADDKFSLSPAVSLIESAVRAPKSVYDAIVNDGKAQKAVRDVATLATMLTGLPFYAAARPLGYAAGVAANDIEPADSVDMARGLVTGVATKESKR